MAERDGKGRFVKGNTSGRGRPPKEYADAFSRIVSPQQWERVIRRAFEQALDGQHDARAWLADRLIGKPPQILELHSADAALLAQLLKQFEAVGVSAGDVFAAMMAQFAEQENETVDDERK